MRLRKICGFFLFFVTTSVIAHDMYFISRPLILKKPQPVNLTLFLQGEEIVWFASQTATFRMKGPDADLSLDVPDEGDPQLQLQKEGTYVIGWQSQPLFVKVDPPIFNKYIVLEGYTDVIRRRAEQRKEQEPGNEVFSRFLKTFIQVGEPKTEHFKENLGFRIEIVPLKNPYSLRKGSDLDVQLFFDGKPLANHKIMATYEGYSTLPEDYAEVTRTDENGIAMFQLSHKGMWMVRSNEMLPVEGNPDVEWESFWANCTFEVR